MALSEAQAPVAAESLRLQALGERDVDAGLALSDAAGWNQTGDDWALFVRHGHAIGLRDEQGRWVATAAALPYGSERGWISMVLVADAWRHRGLASRLMDACVAHLRAGGIVPVLDATPAGAEVYRRIGFVPGFEIDRWERRALHPAREPHSAGAVRPAGAGDRDAVLAFDRASTGLDRGFLLDDFLARPETRIWLGNDGRGFVVARAGRRATQIGPLVAGDTGQAIALLEAAIDASAGSAPLARPGERTIFLDLPRARREVAAWLERQGFVRQRPFVRMALAATEPPRLGAAMFVLAGPEFG
ncbi:MAG: GNAT family N-acetyltransferase [Burkholderiales bacterium]|nr:GNAT family N-acetyltransferase [Burkholderiales bacterium]